MIPGKGVHMYRGVGVRFADLSHLSQIYHENEITETKLSHFHMIFNTGEGANPLWIRHCNLLPITY